MVQVTSLLLIYQPPVIRQVDRRVAGSGSAPRMGSFVLICHSGVRRSPLDRTRAKLWGAVVKVGLVVAAAGSRRLCAADALAAASSSAMAEIPSLNKLRIKTNPH